MEQQRQNLTDEDLLRAVRPPSEEQLIVAVREASRHRLAAFLQLFEEHKDHPGFQIRDWVQTLEYGFTCDCGDSAQDYRIRVSSLRALLPEARKAVKGFLRRVHVRNVNLRRLDSRAARRARALLYRHLTKPQKWQLRSSESFEVIGKDGRRYTVLSTAAGNNVVTTHEGTEISLCVMPAAPMPLYDALLTQKVLLETDPELFLRTAVVFNRKTKEAYQSGAFLVDGGEPIPVKRSGAGGGVPRTDVRGIPDEAAENPGPWLRARMEADRG